MFNNCTCLIFINQSKKKKLNYLTKNDTNSGNCTSYITSIHRRELAYQTTIYIYNIILSLWLLLYYYNHGKTKEPSIMKCSRNCMSTRQKIIEWGIIVVVLSDLKMQKKNSVDNSTITPHITAWNPTLSEKLRNPSSMHIEKHAV